MSWLSEAHSWWWDALLSLNAGGMQGLVLPQLNVPGFVDSPLEALPFLRSEWEGRSWEEPGGSRRRRGRETEVGM